MVTGLASLTIGELGSGMQYQLNLGAALLTIPVAQLFFAFQRHGRSPEEPGRAQFPYARPQRSPGHGRRTETSPVSHPWC